MEENMIWWGLPCLRKDGACFPGASEEHAGDHGFPNVEEDEIRWGLATTGFDVACHRNRQRTAQI
jgi:hypothetical protein